MTARAAPALIEVGRVARAHGVRGEIRVALHWEGSDSLEQVDEVTLRARNGSTRVFEVRNARAADRAVLLSLVGVDDRDAADALRGSIVCVSRTALPALAEGEYYLCDLVGATVFAADNVVGEVVEVRVHPSVDTLVIRAPDGALIEQPIADPWIASVDVEGKRVELTSTDGIVGP